MSISTAEIDIKKINVIYMCPPNVYRKRYLFPNGNWDEKKKI